MRAIQLRLCAVVAGILLGALAASAQAPAALTGTVTSTQEAHDGRRPGQRQAGRLDHHHHGGDRREGPATASRPTASSPASTRSRSAPSATSSTARRRSRFPPAAAPPPTSSSTGAQHPSAALQRRMDGEPARHRPREAVPHRLHRLPHPAAPVHRAARRRRVGPGVQPDGPLLSGLDAGAAATARQRRRPQRAPARRSEDRAEGGAVPGRRQPDQSGRQGIRLQAAAASEGPRHPRDHHRIRPAAEERLSARRGRRCRRQRLVLRLRLAGHGRARSQDRQGHRLRHPGGAARAAQGHARSPARP